MNSISEFVAQPQSGNAELTGALPPVRVLHINSGNLYGGVETILVTLARLRHLCPAMETEFALCHEGRLSQELEAAGATVHMTCNVRISRPWTVWRARRRLREILRAGSFGVVICHMPWAHAVFGKTVRNEGVKLGFWAHGLHTGRGWLERLARITRPDFAVLNSHFIETGVDTIFPSLPKQVIYCPVALNRSTGLNNCRASVRQELGVSAETVVIIQVSRLEAWKGHMLHLRALSLLRDVGLWECWIVGGPQKQDEEEYLRELRREAAQLGIETRVRFLGQRSDIPKLLAAADIFCQPNEGPEPFGIVFIEALLADLPVLTTAMGGPMEIIDDSCGMLVPGSRPDLLAESLRSCIESPELRRRLGRGGADRARQLCDPAAQIKKLYELSQRIVSGVSLP